MILIVLIIGKQANEVSLSEGQMVKKYPHIFGLRSQPPQNTCKNPVKGYFWQVAGRVGYLVYFSTDKDLCLTSIMRNWI